MVTMETPTPRRSAMVATTSSSRSPRPTIRPDLVTSPACPARASTARLRA